MVYHGKVDNKLTCVEEEKMAHTRVIYFGKVNLTSSHIYDVYNGKIQMHDLLQNVLIGLKDGISWNYEYSYIGNDGDLHTDNSLFSVRIKEKTDTYIQGYIDKDSRLYYKSRSSETGELESKSVGNTETIEFYYDVFSEIFGYHTARRFGHKEVLNVFENLIRIAVENCKEGYVFTVARYTSGLNIEEIRQELKGISSIQKIKFTYQPVNPDSEFLDQIEKNGKDKLGEFEDANLATQSVIMTSSSKLGLNIDSNIIKEQISTVNELQRNVSSKDATANGYVKVEATGKDGIVHSTEDKAPIKKEINNILEFKIACQEIIMKRKPHTSPYDDCEE